MAEQRSAKSGEVSALMYEVLHELPACSGIFCIGEARDIHFLAQMFRSYVYMQASYIWLIKTHSRIYGKHVKEQTLGDSNS